MDAPCSLTRHVEARQRLAGFHALAKDRCLQSAHAVMDHRSDDGHIERLRGNCAARDDVVEEFLAAASLPAGLVPRLARRVSGPGATIGVLLGLLGGLIVLLSLVHEGLQGDAHVLSELGAVLVELHDTTAGVMLAVPHDLGGCGLVEHKTEGRLVLPHLAGHIIATAQLIRKALALGTEDKAADTTQGLRRQELHLGVRVIRLHEAGGVHLHPLQIHADGTDRFPHFDRVAGAVLAIGSGQVEKVRAVLGQEGVVAKVGTEAAAAEDDRPELLAAFARLLILAAHHAARVHDELVDTSLVDDLRPVGSLGDLLEGLHERIGDCHPGEALLAAVRPGHRVPAKAGNEGKVQLELVDKPIDTRARLVAEHLGDLGLLGAALQSVGNEDVVGVLNALSLLRLRLAPIDSASGFR
mmetsp:Transcript_22588/g.50540  ORF Transcript_22588/g.50540 Transcript_22588/m.50540 type:complete len:412 (+) Transcript_22588:278-1513(+)